MKGTPAQRCRSQPPRRADLTGSGQQGVHSSHETQQAQRPRGGHGAPLVSYIMSWFKTLQFFPTDHVMSILLCGTSKIFPSVSPSTSLILTFHESFPAPWAPPHPGKPMPISSPSGCCVESRLKEVKGRDGRSSRGHSENSSERGWLFGPGW